MEVDFLNVDQAQAIINGSVLRLIYLQLFGLQPYCWRTSLDFWRDSLAVADPTKQAYSIALGLNGYLKPPSPGVLRSICKLVGFFRLLSRLRDLF